MLKAKANPNVPVSVVLLMDMRIAGKQHHFGDVVELPPNDAAYLSTYNRVADATLENVKEAKKLAAQAAATDEAARKGASETIQLKTLILALQAENAELKKKVK